MLVKNWMSKNVITIDADDSMQHAIKLLKEHKINLLPVMRKGKLSGVITDRDLKNLLLQKRQPLICMNFFIFCQRLKLKI